MAVRFYTCAPFDHAQENKAFENLYFAAKGDLDEKGDVRVIGNVKCRGWPQIDTLVISPRSITIVDYKDYGGTIQLTEEGPWITEERVKVLGGSYTNPFQQVDAYKKALMDLNKAYNLFPYVTNITHITGLVIFTRAICLDNRLSGRITRWFQAGTFDDGMAFLRHQTSREISISTVCMDKLVERLNAKPFSIPPSPTAPINETSQSEPPKDEITKDNIAGTSANNGRLPTGPRRDPPILQRALPYGAALFATVILYFIWQHGVRYDASVRDTHAGAASIAVSETPKTLAAVSDANSPPGNSILASQARAYIGQNKLVCGNVAEVKEIPAGLFINLDKPYPNAAMTAVIWREYINKIGRLQTTENSRVCVSGVIQSYRGTPQIEVERREQISP